MASKKTTDLTVHPEVDQEKFSGAMTGMRAEQMDDVLELGMNLGRLQGLEFVATVANTAQVQIFENVKKSKAWRNLPNPKDATHRAFLSLDEFCEVKLGKSYRRMSELSANMRLLGVQAYEQAETMGLRQVDYNAIKALPAPEQELMRKAVEQATTKEEVLDTLQELAARFAKQKEALDKKVDGLEADLETRNKRVAVLSEDVTSLREQVMRIKTTPPSELRGELLAEFGKIVASVGGAIDGEFAAGVQALADDGADVHMLIMAGAVATMRTKLSAIADRFGLPDMQGQDIPEWIRAASAAGADQQAGGI